MDNRPTWQMASRPLHFFWIVDCSGSMGQEQKIQQLNFSVREALPHMRSVADENPNAQVFIRVLKFSSGAQWLTAQPEPLESFQWTDLNADGVTDMGRALTMLAEQLRIPPMPERALPPVLALVSDGQPTDDFNAGLKAVMDQPWGKKAVRLAISIGSDADNEVLQKFIGNPEIKPYSSNNPEQLARNIRWLSTAVLKAASAPPSLGRDASGSHSNVPVPAPPADNNTPNSADDVW